MDTFCIGDACIDAAFFVLNNITSIDISRIVKHIVLTALISFFVVFTMSYFLGTYEINAWLSLLVSGSSSALIIGGIFYYIEKEKMMRHFISTIKRAIRSQEM